MVDLSGRVRVAVALALAAGLLVACSDGGADGSRPAPAPAPTSTSAPTDSRTQRTQPPLPPAPATADPVRLARQVDRATAMLRAGGNAPADVRRAAQFQQLAAIHLVETRMGRIRGVSTAGAVGPMQFLPTTWDRYGAGGDIRDPGDAVLAAARLLVAHGAPGDMARAVWHYNPSDAYVGAVLSYARTMRRSPAAYHRYWHWRVLYTHERGTHVLPVGYPDQRPVRLPER